MWQRQAGSDLEQGCFKFLMTRTAYELGEICHGFASEPVFGFTSLQLDAAYFLI
jgi:hypothetical protein